MANILIIESGCREHALGWKLSQSNDVSTVFYAPGNGCTIESKGMNIPIDVSKKENFGKLGGRHYEIKTIRDFNR